MTVYFFYPEHGNYDDALIYIAEGLKNLGVNFFSNRTIWEMGLTPDDYLFKHVPDVKYYDCDVVIFSIGWFHYISQDTFQHKFAGLPPEYLNYKHRFYSVLIDQGDGFKTISWEFHKCFDLVLRAKFNNRMLHPYNYKPWVLGFTSRIIKATENQTKFDDRKNEVLVNFNFSHPYEHSIRKIAKKKIINKLSTKININYSVTSNETHFNSYDKLMFDQTEGKHNPEYYKLLGESSLIAAFCGELIPASPQDPSNYLVGGKKAKTRKTIHQILSSISNKTPRIVQWDSWRFWEALVAGCIPIHLDLEKYGVELPIMPKNWEHYIGIDLDHIERDINRIIDDDATLRLLSEKGREWALIYYSPKASAKRLLNLIGYDV